MRFIVIAAFAAIALAPSAHAVDHTIIAQWGAPKSDTNLKKLLAEGYEVKSAVLEYNNLWLAPRWRFIVEKGPLLMDCHDPTLFRGLVVTPPVCAELVEPEKRTVPIK